jgi:hypothetical protein
LSHLSFGFLRNASRYLPQIVVTLIGSLILATGDGPCGRSSALGQDSIPYQTGQPIFDSGPSDSNGFSLSDQPQVNYSSWFRQPPNFQPGTAWQMELGDDKGRRISAHNEIPDIPEPMLFDLIRPLGAKRGEVEFNTLAIFPWRAVNRDLDRDPFGSGQTTRDREGIEWAPEIEFAFADGWAVEFELPFEGQKLEAYKFALQGTFGTAFDNRYIHGFQTIVEPTPEWSRWNSTLLYLGGIKFDEQWSALFMVGGRIDLAGRGNAGTFERLVNASLFREIRDDFVLGMEVNHAVGNRGRSQTILVPQFHYDLTRQIQLQSGIGLGVFDQGSEQSFIMRVVFEK